MDDDYDLRDFDHVTRLFPLPGVVLFPHVVLPLHIFEPRYRRMTEDALASDKLVTIAQVCPDADWSGPSEPALEPVACLGRILTYDRLPDGRFNFLLLGRKRVRLVRERRASTLYRQAEVEILEDVEPPSDPSGRRDDLIALFRAVAGRSGPLDPDLANLLRSELSLGVLTDILAHALGLPPGLKQSFLEECRVTHRAERLIEVLRPLALGPPLRPPFPPPFSPN